MESINVGREAVTQELWEYWLRVYVQDGDAARVNRLWKAYPNFAAQMMREFDHIVLQADTHISKEETLTSWEQMKAQLREEYGEDFI